MTLEKRIKKHSKMEIVLIVGGFLLTSALSLYGVYKFTKSDDALGIGIFGFTTISAAYAAGRNYQRMTDDNRRIDSYR